VPVCDDFSAVMFLVFALSSEWSAPLLAMTMNTRRPRRRIIPQRRMTQAPVARRSGVTACQRNLAMAYRMSVDSSRDWMKVVILMAVIESKFNFFLVIEEQK
jgi:hypothetical protein